MKLSISKKDGTLVDIEGTQEECVAALHALFGVPPLNLQGLGQQPQPVSPLQPFVPGPLPDIQPNPWPTITWGDNTTCPWPSGTVLMPYNKDAVPVDSCASNTLGYLVQGNVLKPLSQGEFFQEMGNYLEGSQDAV